MVFITSVGSGRADGKGQILVFSFQFSVNSFQFPHRLPNWQNQYTTNLGGDGGRASVSHVARRVLIAAKVNNRRNPSR